MDHNYKTEGYGYSVDIITCMYLFKSLSGEVSPGNLTFDPCSLLVVGGERLEQLNGQTEVVGAQRLVGGAYLPQEAHQRNCGKKERERESEM